MDQKSTWTEWSTTSATGTSGSMTAGSLPRRSTAERIAARSTSSGTPVKSCRMMRATTNGISAVRSAFGFQLRQPANVLLLDPLAVQVAQDGFEDDP